MEDYFELNYADNLARKDEKVIKKNKKEGNLVYIPETEKMSVRALAMRIVLIAVLFVMAILNIFVYAEKNDLHREICKTQEIVNTNFARIRELDAQLDALVSPEKIEKTAVEKLGLIKISDSDWNYISINETNSVIISDGNVNG